VFQEVEQCGWFYDEMAQCHAKQIVWVGSHNAFIPVFRRWESPSLFGGFPVSGFQARRGAKVVVLETGFLPEWVSVPRHDNDWDPMYLRVTVNPRSVSPNGRFFPYFS
jgi:hypothetical protein